MNIKTKVVKIGEINDYQLFTPVEDDYKLPNFTVFLEIEDEEKANVIDKDPFGYIITDQKYANDPVPQEYVGHIISRIGGGAFHFEQIEIFNDGKDDDMPSDEYINKIDDGSGNLIPEVYTTSEGIELTRCLIGLHEGETIRLLYEE